MRLVEINGIINGSEVSSIDYVKQCKDILMESNACKNLSNNILKVVLKMSQELNSKTEQIKAMTENISSAKLPNTSTNEILSKLDKISEKLEKRSYKEVTVASPKINNEETTKKKVSAEGHILRLYPTTQDTKVTLAETKKLLLPHLQKHPVIRIKELRNEGILVELAQKSSISEIGEIINANMKNTIKVL